MAGNAGNRHLPPERGPAARGGPALAAAAVVALFLAGALPLILCGYNGGRGGYDSLQYHLPAVESVARQWPRPDFTHFSSATTPGYHVVLALLRRYAGVGVRGLRLAGSLFTAGWLATQAAAAARRAGAGTAVALCLPLVCSPYVFDSGAWVLPDNAGWWAVLCVMLVAFRGRADGWFYAAGGGRCWPRCSCASPMPGAPCRCSPRLGWGRTRSPDSARARGTRRRRVGWPGSH